MAVFAIGDLHLSGHNEKPMDVFGSQWYRHFETISANWRSQITDNDVVLIPGDISWAMQLGDAADDLRAIAALPGKKILLRGNHDYWWSSLAKIREILPDGMTVIQNDAICFDGCTICGTRGWNFPVPHQPFSEQDEKILRRELLRLRMSLDQAVKLQGEKLIVMLHFPPCFSDIPSTAFTELLEQYPVDTVVYGHLHGAGIKIAFQGVKRGIRYLLTSCDSLNFCPLRVLPYADENE